MLLLFIAVLCLVVLYFGNKIAAESVWYLSISDKVNIFLFYDVLLMLAATVTKLIMATRYNKLLKR